MSATNDELRAMLARPELPRSAEYDPRWVLENQMGPNALWLTEWMCQAMRLHPGMRVLDLGCGRGLSSIFWPGSMACKSGRRTFGSVLVRTRSASGRRVW